MHLKQLIFLCRIADEAFNVSEAAKALHISQPSVSRQIRALEEELGVAVFVRRKRRFLGLTKPGAEVLRIARHILQDTDSLKNIGKQYMPQEAGTLTVAASHTNARYILPRVIREFTEQHPKIDLVLRQGTPLQMDEWVSNGEVDIAISSGSIHFPSDVVQLPYYNQNKVVLVPAEHPLLSVQPLTLEALAEHPIIAYDTQFLVRSHVTHAFDAKNLRPRIVLSATDVDVIKAYVRHGMGVAIVAELAYDREQDSALRTIQAKHLFPPSRINIGIRKNSYLRSFTFDFILALSPSLTKTVVERAIFDGQ